MQAAAVAIAARDYMGLKFDKRELSALPKELLEGIDVLLKTEDESGSPQKPTARKAPGRGLKFSK